MGAGSDSSPHSNRSPDQDRPKSYRPDGSEIDGGNTARYLNSEADFKSEKNFAIFIPNIALPAFQTAGADDPGKYYYGKTIIVSGTVSIVQNRPQIRVEDPTQIKVVTSQPAKQRAK